MTYIIWAAFTHVEFESIVSVNDHTLTCGPICIILWALCSAQSGHSIFVAYCIVNFTRMLFYDLSFYCNRYNGFDSPSGIVAAINV